LRFWRDSQDVFEPALKDVTDPPVPAVHLLGIHPVELSHASGEIAFGSFDDQVVMTGHLAPGMERPVVALADLRQHFEPNLPVKIVQVNIFLPITPGSYVVQPTREFQAQRTRHSRSECYIARRDPFTIPIPTKATK
jgi:hypothetical protein